MTTYLNLTPDTFVQGYDIMVTNQSQFMSVHCQKKCSEIISTNIHNMNVKVHYTGVFLIFGSIGCFLLHRLMLNNPEFFIKLGLKEELVETLSTILAQTVLFLMTLFVIINMFPEFFYPVKLE